MIAPIQKTPFSSRHIGPRPSEIDQMLQALCPHQPQLSGDQGLDTFCRNIIPKEIALVNPLPLASAVSENEALEDLRGISKKNKVYRSLIGMGYFDCFLPSVIQRNIFENPGWYTQYTPYQAEIAQGRLEALLNFQTMIAELTGLPIANASLLDEATAAAEAMTLCYQATGRPTQKKFFASKQCHPQTLAILRTRAEPLGIEIVEAETPTQISDFFAGIFQYPTTTGLVEDLSSTIQAFHDAQALVILASDLLSLTFLKPPGELHADIAVGSAQRFGIPLGFGGPHPAFFATQDALKRLIPWSISR
jgi:glycine dehydrogenase